jgi:hypothetical protein
MRLYCPRMRKKELLLYETALSRECLLRDAAILRAFGRLGMRNDPAHLLARRLSSDDAFQASPGHLL